MTFTVTVEPSGRTFTATENETLLAAAIRQGIGLPYGCKDGACGSCKSRKLSGSVTHGPHQSKALSADEEAAGMILTCCAVAHSDVVIESRQVTEAGAFPVKKLPVRVQQLERVTDDVMIVRLQLPSNDTFQYHAGQYIEILLRDGSRRAYSMALAPHVSVESPVLELHIRHTPGGKFTDYVFSALKEREIWRIEGPFGSFYLREDSDKPIILLASGTGFAPIKAIMQHMQHKGIGRATWLYWGGRRPHDLYQDAWVRELAAQMPNLTYVPVVSDALPEDHWQGRTGFVHQAVLADHSDLSGFEVYACGAPVVVESARRDYTAAGLPPEAFFADAFTTEADKAQN